MKRVTGIGGIFFKCQDPDLLKQWYSKHLGLNVDQWGTNFESRSAIDPSKKTFIQWSPSKSSQPEINRQEQPVLINYRVADLEALVSVLRTEGVVILDEIEFTTYGKFVHIEDLEANKVQLWEPNDEVYDEIVEGRTK